MLPKKSEEQHPVQPLPGSLHSQWVRCGKTCCRCADDGPLHGPYYYRFYREARKQHKEYVPKGQVEQVRIAIQLWKFQHPPISSFEKSLQGIDQIYKKLTQESIREQR